MATATPTHSDALADAFEAMAEVEIQMQEDDQFVHVPAITHTVERLTPHMRDYDRELWWGELKRCLISRKEARDGNAPWHDGAGVDWDARVAEALNRLTGEE